MTTQGISHDPVLSEDWHVVARAGDIAPGAFARARLLGEDLFVWRDAEGGIHVWQDLCIHRGARLSLGKIEAGCVVCPYHGWRYNTEGNCVLFPAHPTQTPPARARVKTYAARERYGLVWASQGQPAHDIPAFAEWDDPDYRKVVTRPTLFKASAPRVMENTLDITHFPFVHEGILGDPAHAEINDYTVALDAEGIKTGGIEVYQNDADGTGRSGNITYYYAAPRPLTTLFRKAAGGPGFAVLLNISPAAEMESIAWGVVAMNYNKDTPEEEILAFQELLLAQDIGIVESQRPERLPRDLQEELHLRSDRAAIAYRRWINDLGMMFGTA